MLEKKPKQNDKKVKLELNRETLRKLSNAELARAHGGIRPESEDLVCDSENRGNQSHPSCE